MPPRRTTKKTETVENTEPKTATRSSARSTTKKSTAATTVKPAATRTKRAASSESSRTPPPVNKRARNVKAKMSDPTDAAPEENVDAPPPTQKAKTATKRSTTTPGLKKNGSKASVESAMNTVPAFPDPIRPAGQLFVWGCGDFGQFGLGPTMLQEFPKPKKHTWVEDKMNSGVFGSEPNAGIIEIAAGGMHSLFIDENGTVWSCGVNDEAALGRITKDVPDPANEGAFLNSDVLCMIPHPLQSLIDDGYKAVKVAAGDSISAAISTEGKLRVWGSFRANEGALGFANGLQQQLVPMPVLENEQCVQVVTGNNHLLVLTAQGHIYSWGTGEQGQLGRKIMERRKIHGTVPERVILGIRSRRARVIGAGNLHSFAVDAQGDVWGWGLNGAGQTGTGIEAADVEAIVQTPRRVIGLSPEELGHGARVKEIVGGDLHTLFLTTDGRVYACGRADGAALGLPADHPAIADGQATLSEPTLVPFPDDHNEDPVVHIAAGTRANAAVTESGAMYTWGEGSQGELGLGDVETAQTPQVVVRRAGGAWAALAASCGGMHGVSILRKKDT